MGSFKPVKKSELGGRPPGKIDASLNEQLNNVEWGEYTYKDIFNNIQQGRRLKKSDQISGNIPFVMAGATNTGVVKYISNPVASFPKNSITIDIFGNTFYRNYAFGAGDDTGVYWNSEKEYSKNQMLFLAAAMGKSLENKFSYGNKLRSSQSYNFKIYLPQKDGKIDFEFMESFTAELEAERTAELEAERTAELEAYLKVSGLKNYQLSVKEQKAIDNINNVAWCEYKITDVFNIKNTRNILSRDITENSGNIPYLGAGEGNNSVISYISYDLNMTEKGQCIFIGGKTFVVTYQPCDFFSNDSHNLALYVKDTNLKNKLCQLALTSCVYKSLKHKYSWGDSISFKKIQKDNVLLPQKDGKIDFEYMETLISAIQKLVIKDVVLYTDKKIAATKQIISRS